MSTKRRKGERRLKTFPLVVCAQEYLLCQARIMTAIKEREQWREKIEEAVITPGVERFSDKIAIQERPDRVLILSFEMMDGRANLREIERVELLESEQP